MKEIRLKAYGKINLCLDVLGKREDGYHDVRMIMQTVGLFDRLYMEITDDPMIRLTTNLSYLPTGESNLVYRAIESVRQEFHLTQGIRVDLQKFIPVAAGMAGGSSDAAAALVGMDRLFHLQLPLERLMDLGVRLGADVPYCLMRGTALSEGIGERLSPLPAPPDCTVLIAKPKVSASTKLVYERFDSCEHVGHPDIEAMIEGLHQNDLEKIAASMGNVLEAVTSAEYPVIGDIKKVMLVHGAIGAMMTGSGPTVFGLFADPVAAERARTVLRADDRIRSVYITGWFHPSRGPVFPTEK